MRREPWMDRAGIEEVSGPDFFHMDWYRYAPGPDGRETEFGHRSTGGQHLVEGNYALALLALLDSEDAARGLEQEEPFYLGGSKWVDPETGAG